MPKHERSSRFGGADLRLEQALAYLLASTRRTRRSTDLLRVPQELAIARDRLGSLKAVSRAIAVSPEMLREFASVEKLSSGVKKMISEGRLTSVDVAYRLSMLPKHEQVGLAREYTSGNLSLKEVRDVVSFSKRKPNLALADIVRRVKSSRSITRYIIKVPLEQQRPGIRVLRRRLAQLIGKENIVCAEAGGDVATLTITEEGRARLLEQAKKHRVSRRVFLQDLLLGGDLSWRKR